ncbi:MAG: hypothetical protein HQ582_16635 [Planctomycetes bacterium]|nr:hypothetical protein [Planctomycetota bacterium]
MSFLAKLGVTSIVVVVIVFSCFGASTGASCVTCWTAPRSGFSGRVTVPAYSTPAGSREGSVPGNVLCATLDTAILPSRSSNRAIKLICRSGPPVSPQGSQKL